MKYHDETERKFGGFTKFLIEKYFYNVTEIVAFENMNKDIEFLVVADSCKEGMEKTMTTLGCHLDMVDGKEYSFSIEESI